MKYCLEILFSLYFSLFFQNRIDFGLFVLHLELFALGIYEIHNIGSNNGLVHVVRRYVTLTFGFFDVTYSNHWRFSLVTALVALQSPPDHPGSMGVSASSVSSSSLKDAFLDKVLTDKSGVFTADFDEANGTEITVRDGTSALLDCKVYLRHDKTVKKVMASGWA